MTEIANCNVPRILIGATGSGSGKTTLVCGILKALIKREKKIAAFKCGPDYIDPMFHKEALGLDSRNIDLFFNDINTVNCLLAENSRDCELSIIEGVMGYYDGLAGKSFEASAYDVAIKTHTPAILIIDCKGKSVSIIAEIKGFLEFQPNSNIRGVILNRISPAIYNEISNMIEEKLNIKVYGYMPNVSECSLESRHLGLVTAKEVINLSEILDKLAVQCEQTVDITGLIKIANEAPVISYEKIELFSYLIDNKENGNTKIAVAMDKAFCFYYKDNLELLEKLGAELVYFSPLLDSKLPKDISGLYLGGGYPELYLEKLAQNLEMLESIKKAISNGLPTIAECGGFMYLHDVIKDKEGKSYPMVGAIEGESFFANILVRFGYVELTAIKDNLLCNKGEKMKGHEFHYWDSTNSGELYVAQKPLRKANWKCVVGNKNLYAGYPHIHFYSNVTAAENFIKACIHFEI